MMNAAGVHAEGERDFRRVVTGGHGQRHLRFTVLVERLCKRRGVLATFRISAAWRRIRSRPDKSRCLWLGA